MFSYPCPSCSQKLQAAAERVGQRTICPKCLSPIVIPQASGVAAVAVPASLEEHLHLNLPAMAVDSPSTIFVDDFATSEDDEDGMDLSLPDDAEEFAVFGNDSVPYPEEPAAAAPAPEMAMPPPMAPLPGLVGVGANPAMDHTPLPPRVPPPRGRDPGVVVFQSTPIESANIAAELTHALTMRMKPPPEPPGDLRLSTGAWLAINAAGLSLWMLSMLRGDDDQGRQLLNGVGLLGAVQIVISYIWVAYLGGRKSLRRGLEALLPPVWLYRLAIPESNTVGFRPLRFLMTGLLLLALAMLGSQVRPKIHAVFGEPPTEQVELPKPDHPTLRRLRDARATELSAPLIAVLQEMSRPGAYAGLPPEDFAKVVAELEELCGDPTAKPKPRPGADDSEVRAAALVALWWFTPDHDAMKPRIIEFLMDPVTSSRVRKAAIDLARKHKDVDVARALVACLALPKILETSNVVEAKDALKGMGPPEAETALLEKLVPKETAFNDAVSLLGEIGGERSLARMKELADNPDCPEGTRRTLLDAAERIDKRLQSRRKAKP